MTNECSVQTPAYRAQKQVKLMIDSCADLSSEVVRALDIEIVPFSFIMSDGEHLDDFWQSMSPRDFYERMRKGEDVKTCAVTPGRYFDIFERAAQEGVPTVYLAFTRGLSSSIEAARTAQEMIHEKYPDFELYIVDNLCPSAAAQLLALEALNQISQGLTARELVTWAEEARYYIHGFFTLDSFDALARGGRIPPAAAQVGGKLDIKPELSYDLQGALSLRAVCRGRKKALRSVLAHVKENYIVPEVGEPKLPIALVSADAEKDMHWLAEQMRKEEEFKDIPMIFSSVSPVIGAHTGPGMVAVVFWGKDRRESLSFTDRLARRVRADKPST